MINAAAILRYHAKANWLPRMPNTPSENGRAAAWPFTETARPYWPPLKPATPRRESVSRLWALHRNAHSSLNKRAGQQEAEFALRRAAPKKSFPMPPDTAVCNAKPVEKTLSIVRRAGCIWKFPRAVLGEVSLRW